jgi:hypothetical protein
MNYTDILTNLERRRNNILMGKVNCIPSPFPRFSDDFVGIEQGKLTIVSASTKVGKTQLTNFIYVYNTLFYAFANKDKVRLKIMYFNLEETEENITLRFISYLLYYFSKGKYRIGTKDLKSTRANRPLDENILTILKEEPYKSIMEFYNEVVEFRPERNPTGIKKAIESYCVEHGTVKRKKLDIVNKETGLTETVDAFDSYIPDDPDLYFIPIVDHLGLVTQESGLSLKGSMDLMSSYFVQLRNRYNISPVEVIQQAADMESNENVKMKRIRPTTQGLGDSKTVSRDCDLMLGLSSPYRFELPNYLGYDISKFRNHIRFMEIVINREGEQNSICPLYFDGKSNFFAELPLPNDPAIEKYYNTIAQLNILKRKRKTLWQKLKNLFVIGGKHQMEQY